MRQNHGAVKFDCILSFKLQLNQNGEFLWRLCKAVYLYAINIGVRGDASGKKALIDEACELGKGSCKIAFRCLSTVLGVRV